MVFFASLFAGLDLYHGVGHGSEGAVVNAQGGGGFGVDGDDASVHHVEFRNRAAQQDVHSHVGGVGAELGVVDAAGGEGTVADKGVSPGIVGDAGLGQIVGNGQLGGHDNIVGGG